MERWIEGKPRILVSNQYEDCFVRDRIAALYRLGDWQVIAEFPKGTPDELIRLVCEREWRDTFAQHHFDKRISEI